MYRCIEEQNNEYDNEDIVDCLNVLDLEQICEEGISNHELFFWQTTIFAGLSENKIQEKIRI